MNKVSKIASNRDLDNYLKTYLGPFEEIQISYRRKKVIEIIENYTPEIILEVGCGKDSLVNYLSQDTISKFYIVEPISDFLKVAVKKKSDKIICINEKIENVATLNTHLDFIIISSLLHEVVDPLQILKNIYNLAEVDTVIHINTPNSLSFHRLLAKEMGMIKSLYERSETQILLQQHHTFDLCSFIKLAEDAGFEVIEKGSFFIKPFTHSQMQQMLDKKILGMNVIEGLYKMIKYIPEMGSEIFLNIRKKAN